MSRLSPHRAIATIFLDLWRRYPNPILCFSFRKSSGASGATLCHGGLHTGDGAPCTSGYCSKASSDASQTDQRGASSAANQQDARAIAAVTTSATRSFNVWLLDWRPTPRELGGHAENLLQSSMAIGRSMVHVSRCAASA